MKDFSLKQTNADAGLGTQGKKIAEYRSPDAVVVGKASKLLQGNYSVYWDMSDYSSSVSSNLPSDPK